MLLVVFGFILAFFWYRALRVQPTQYPLAKPGDVLAWQAHRIHLYRRYAALLVLAICLELSYQLIGGWYTRTHSMLSAILVYVAVGLYLGLTAFLGVYAGLHCLRNRTWAREHGLR